MLYLAVVAIAKLLRRNPQELWQSFAKGAMWTLIYFVFFFALYMFVGWGVETLGGSNHTSATIPTPRPTTTTTADPFVTKYYNENGEQTGVSSFTPSLP